jgi:hypothetical protein
MGQVFNPESDREICARLYGNHKDAGNIFDSLSLPTQKHAQSLIDGMVSLVTLSVLAALRRKLGTHSPYVVPAKPLTDSRLLPQLGCLG